MRRKDVVMQVNEITDQSGKYDGSSDHLSFPLVLMVIFIDAAGILRS